jgi:tetratricopeptide (TPR) repeat protein
MKGRRRAGPARSGEIPAGPAPEPAPPREAHPPPGAIDGFIEVLPADARDLLTHLIQCGPCGTRALAGMRREPPVPPGYDGLFERIEHQAAELAERHGIEMAEAESLLPEFLVLASRRRSEAIQGEPRYQTMAFAHLLERTAQELSGKDVVTAQELLLLAIGVGEQLGGTAASPVLLADLQARLYTELAETHRRTGSFDTAEEALVQAAGYLALHPAIDTRARYCWILGRLRADLGRDDEALALFGRAAQLYGEVRDARQFAAVAFETGRRHLALGEVWRARQALHAAIAQE